MSPVIPVGAKVTGDASGFVGAMGTATRGLTAFTGAAGLATTAMGAFAGAIALGAAVNAARDFERELVKLNTLVGIQTEEIEEWESSLKDLAVATGQAPTDMAKAMFAITSGGARGTAALDLLEQSAQAAAIGLGDMSSIGRVAGAIVTAFGDEGVTASKAIDTLVGTVRLGNLEASSLATAFSRVLGPAKALGAGVADIGGFLATFTRLGGSTEDAATGLLNVFNLLLGPPTAARAAMEDFGFSIEEVRETLREDGLPAALAIMVKGFEGNIDALKILVPNTRAMTGILNTAGLQADSFASDVADLSSNLGENDRAFEQWGKSNDAAFQQFGAQAQVIGIEIGQNLLPPLVELLRVLRPISEVLRLSAEGWKILFDSLSDDEGTIRTIQRWLGILPEQFETAEFAAVRLAAAVEAASFATLIRNTTEADATLERLKARLVEVNAALEGKTAIQKRNAPFLQQMVAEEMLLTAQIEVQSGIVDANTEEFNRRTKAQEGSTKAAEEGVVVEAAVTEERQKQLDAIEDIIAALELEQKVIEEGEFARIAATLAQQDAVFMDVARAAGLFATIEALKAAAEAEAELERSLAATNREAERERKRLEERKNKALKDARDAAIRLAEDTRLAIIQNQIREVTDESKQMAETMGQAFSDIADGTKSVGEAFASMVTDILRQLQRLIIQKSIVEPILGFLVNNFAPGASSVDSGAVELPAGFQTTNDKPFFSDDVFGSASSIAAGGGGGNTIVQNITFSPNLIDGASGARFIEQHSGTISNIVADGARNSGQLTSAFQGQNQ